MQWKKNVLQFEIITIRDGKIHFYWSDFLSPSVVEIWEWLKVKRTHHRWYDKHDKLYHYDGTFSNSSGSLSKMVLLIKRYTFSHQISFRVVEYKSLLQMTNGDETDISKKLPVVGTRKNLDTSIFSTKAEVFRYYQYKYNIWQQESGGWSGYHPDGYIIAKRIAEDLLNLRSWDYVPVLSKVVVLSKSRLTTKSMRVF